MLRFPRLVIAGVHSGVGKTTLATAIIASISGLGLRVQPFKVGPDYIDPGYHSTAAGVACRNLDAWFLGDDGVREMFARSAPGADISIIEGVMGLYDGRGAGSEGSTAHVAKILQAPVVLVVDARSMAASAAALIMGYKVFDPGVNLAGVIFNMVGGERHFALLREATEKIGVPVLGWVGRQQGEGVPQRHLGLVPTAENKDLAGTLDKFKAIIGPGLELQKIIDIAQGAPDQPDISPSIFPRQRAGGKVRLGVVLDSAFNFYYQDGLDLLRAMGAEIIYCSALEGGLPPDLDGLYIGGGFPEMFASRLAANLTFLEGIRAAHKSGLPIYAECGGLMYLCRSVTDFDGRQHALAGIVPGECQMERKRKALGYVSATACVDNLLCRAGESLKGHEFHYSSIVFDEGAENPAFLLSKEGKAGCSQDGYVSDNVLASYLHVHFCGSPASAERLLEHCRRFGGINRQ